MMTTSSAEIWDRVLNILRDKLTPTTIATWFNDIEAVDFGSGSFVLKSPSPFKKELIETRYVPYIRDALLELFSEDYRVVVVDDEGEREYSKNSLPPTTEEIYTFDNFIVGNSNKFAHAAALAVAEENTKDYNPLFIYGNSGLGKTHLLYAIRHALSRKHPEYNIIYKKGDDFTNELIIALKQGGNTEFRNKYRGADVFLMDDVQFIAGKESSQEEFFNTFNTLFESGRQIVFTSDRPPSEIAKLEDRLRTRFEWGLLADIQPPDYETRMAIIQNKASQLSAVLPMEVSNYIAENLTYNVRQIEGAVKMIVARHELLEDNVNMNMVAKVVKDMFRGESIYQVTVESIIEDTARYYSVTTDDIKGPNRTRSITLARHVAMYICRTLTNLSLKDIGAKFNDRDHTTVKASVENVETSMKDSIEFSQTVRDIIANINSKN